MIIKRAVSHRVQMPNQYESVTVTAELTVDTEELTESVVGEGREFDKVDELLNTAIENDLKEATRLSDPDSYVREWNNG